MRDQAIEGIEKKLSSETKQLRGQLLRIDSRLSQLESDVIADHQSSLQTLDALLQHTNRTSASRKLAHRL